MTGEIAKGVDRGARVTKDRSSGWPMHRKGRAKSRGVPRSTPVGDWWLGEKGRSGSPATTRSPGRTGGLFGLFLNGICLAVLVLALRERLSDSSPRLAKIASVWSHLGRFRRPERLDTERRHHCGEPRDMRVVLLSEGCRMGDMSVKKGLVLPIHPRRSVLALGAFTAARQLPAS